jgi:outer membrane protein OmpA-like peptidoglycan-associated protein
MKRIIILITISINFLFAGLYDYKYNVNSKVNVSSPAISNLLMYGDFEKIIRFDALQFDKDTNKMSKNSQKELDKIVDTIKDYGDKKIIVTMIGYTKHVETHNEKIMRKSALGYKNIINDQILHDNSVDDSLSYSKSVEKYLVDNNISKDILIVEERRGEEKAYTEGTNLGKDLNYRVMVAIYEPVKIAFNKKRLKSKEINKKDMGTRIIDLKINYANDSAVIPKDQEHKVRAFATFMKAFPKYSARIVGHTSSVAPADYNKKLSQRRSDGVVKMLVSLGINKSRLSAIGKGEDFPIASNKTKKGQLKNRRTIAELYIK